MNVALPSALGLLVPASNRVMEGDFIRWTVCDGLALHSHRLQAPVHRPADMRQNLQALSEGVDEAARLLGLAAPAVIAFGCTSGTFLRGHAWDEALRERISAALGGVPMVSTASAIVEALRALGARRIAVVSPYPAEVNELMCRFLEDSRFSVSTVHSVDGWRTGNIANVAPETVHRLAREAVSTSSVDACFISCTNLRAATLVHGLESELQVPVVTANQATYWAALRRLSSTPSEPTFGMLRGH